MNQPDPRNGRALALFTALALGLSVAYWLLFRLRDHGLLPFDPAGGAWGAARGYGPALAALITAAAVYGRAGPAEIVARLKRWRIPPRLWLLALLGPLVASALLVPIVRLLGTAAEEAGDVRPGRMVLLFLVFALVDGPIGEEIGWRGFFLPRLIERCGPIAASLVLGVVWYLWHLPLYDAVGREMTAAFLARYLVNNVAFSLVHTWFFQRSGGSALLAIVLHTAGNYWVYTTATLFPEVRTAEAARVAWVALLAVAGLAAAGALARRPEAGARESAGEAS